MALFSHEDNEVLTRVGPGSLMGNMLREHWVPILRSERLVADGAPVRVRLYGRNYVAFRATDGQVGFFNEGCPHRGVSLALADNRGNGLRCIYHGWKFDVSGKTVQVPTEPSDCAAAFANSVSLHHYPVRETGGLIWVFPQDDKAPPPFPDFEFTHLPLSHVDVRIGLFRVNWLQAMESVLDSAHLGQLHRSSFDRPHNITVTEKAVETMAVLRGSDGPRFEIAKTPWGFTEAALRSLKDGRRYVNLRQFVAPFYSFLPSAPTDPNICCAAIAHDDEWMSQIIITYRLDRPITQDERDAFWEYANPDPDNFAGDLGSADNSWGQDRDAMKAGYASGFPHRHIFQEDFIVQESMGAIIDRTQEHLGSSDVPIIHARRELIRGAIAFAKGEPAWGHEALDAFAFSHIRSTARFLDADEDWRAIDPVAEYADEVLREAGNL